MSAGAQPHGQATQQLILETLETLETYLPKLHRGMIDVAGDLQSSESAVRARGFARLAEVAEGLVWVMDATTNVRLLVEDTFAAKAATVSEELDVVKGLADYVTTNLEAQDFSTCSDILSHELAPLLHGWRQPINSLRKEIAAHVSSDEGESDAG